MEELTVLMDVKKLKEKTHKVVHLRGQLSQMQATLTLHQIQV